MADELKKRYYKLGKNASSFYDPGSQLTIVNQQVSMLTTKPTKFIENAVRHTHIQEVGEEDYEKWIRSDEVKDNEPLKKASESKDLTKMTGAQLTSYYRNNFQTSEDDLKAFAKMTVPEKREFLIADDEEEDEEPEE